MEKISLPIAPAGASPRDAYKLLKEAKCGAVVQASGQQFAIYDLDQILRGIRRKGRKLSAMKPRYRASHFSPKEHGFRTLRSRKATLTTRDEMDDRGDTYLVVGLSGNRAQLLTRHEQYASIAYYTPGLWECSRDPDEVWTTQDLEQPGNKCPVHGVQATSV